MNDIARYFEWANTETFKTIKGTTTGREYHVREFTYGVLVPDYNHPLSAVSVSNNSLSIDLWKGCSWQCRYCHVQGTLADLSDGQRMGRKPQLRTPFTIDEIINELVKHPFFIPDVTVISIGTASTEPFADGPVANSTFDIMEAFIRRGFRNPFWIVTKANVPKGRKQDIAAITKVVKGLMISICWVDNPQRIEPIRNNRFLYSEEAKEAGATISWYMRPMVPEWSGYKERIEMMMLWVKNYYGDVIDVIVPGGLRWTEGIEYGLVEIHDLPLPDIPRTDNVKALPSALWDLIIELGREHFPNVPIYRHSSCSLTHMLQVASLTSVETAARIDCERSFCPAAQRQLCATGGIHQINLVTAQRVLKRLGVPARVIRFDSEDGLLTDPDLSIFTYAIQQTVLKFLSLGGNNCALDRADIP